jgi:hypothetical protein
LISWGIFAIYFVPLLTLGLYRIVRDRREEPSPGPADFADRPVSPDSAAPETALGNDPP